MTTSKRIANAKTSKFQSNVHRRGSVTDTLQAKERKLPVGPVMLGFFLFVVVGSALLQIIRTATSPPPL